MAETHGRGTGPTDNQSRGGGSPGNANLSSSTMGDLGRSASEMTQSAYEQSRNMAQRAGERYPQARHYLERGTQAISEAPFASLLAVGAVGLGLAWMMGGLTRSEDRTSSR